MNDDGPHAHAERLLRESRERAARNAHESHEARRQDPKGGRAAAVDPWGDMRPSADADAGYLAMLDNVPELPPDSTAAFSGAFRGLAPGTSPRGEHMTSAMSWIERYSAQIHSRAEAFPSGRDFVELRCKSCTETWIVPVMSKPTPATLACPGCRR